MSNQEETKTTMSKELSIPLQFWFNRTPDLSIWNRPAYLSTEEIINKLCKEDEDFADKYNKLVTSYMFDNPIPAYTKYTDQLYDDVDYVERQVSALKPGMIYPRIVYMQEYYDMAQRFSARYNPKYELPLLMSTNETINGYDLYDTNDCFMRKSTFDTFARYWNENRQYSKKRFMKYYNDFACSEWSKMDKYGDYYNGFYNYPEGTYQREHAWELTRRDNGLALYNLPYPKRVILETIKYSCNTLKECVRYTNFLCEWIKRKMHQMNQPGSLQDICKNSIAINNININQLPLTMISSLRKENIISNNLWPICINHLRVDCDYIFLSENK